MIEETARVLATDGDFAWVETQRQSDCGSCAAKSACSTGVLQEWLGGKASRMRALNQARADVGDLVVVGMREQALVRGSIALYAAPLLAMFIGALLGEQLGLGYQAVGEGPASGGGVAGLLLGFVWLRGFAQRISRDGCYQAVILKQADKRVRSL